MWPSYLYLSCYIPYLYSYPYLCIYLFKHYYISFRYLAYKDIYHSYLFLKFYFISFYPFQF